MQDTMDVQKCFSKLAQVGSSCHVESGHVHTSLGCNNTNKLLEDLSLSQAAFFSEVLQLASTTVLDKERHNWVRKCFTIYICAYLSC